MESMGNIRCLAWYKPFSPCITIDGAWCRLLIISWVSFWWVLDYARDTFCYGFCH